MKINSKDQQDIGHRHHMFGYGDDALNDMSGTHFGMDDFLADGDSGDTTTEEYMMPGSKFSRQLIDMKAIEQIARRAGWLKPSPDGVDPIDTSVFQPDIFHPSSKWKAVVQEERQTLLKDRIKNLPENQEDIVNSSSKKRVPDDVRLLDAAYFNKNFKAEQVEAQQLIDDAVTKFALNKEQERAFRIVANHAASPNAKQLKMYLGGMGGTGKSRVILSLIYFFNERKESHRFLVVAPTGTAAALLNGSTYHSVFGVRTGAGSDGVKNISSSIAQVRERLQGVEYIFLDEVSMVSCRELYMISVQLALALNIHGVPFGGLNFIFAGDFAQLPPVGSGGSLYSGSVGTQRTSMMSVAAQEAVIGKVLWHQITTVVILRQNMRQKSQTDEDASLRKALVNMRYAACTPQDIIFLRSLISSGEPGQKHVSQKKFRNISVITGWNVQKDRLNELGINRFANDTNQELTDFFSTDKLNVKVSKINKGKTSRTKLKAAREIDPRLQAALWASGHASSQHIPGKLSLCIGMPVMIRHNFATELCITKGQEGVVHGWQTIKVPTGELALDTLFVKLSNPPKDINIPGLPTNIVPIPRSSQVITCELPCGSSVTIDRLQVLVLPNFSMTDYAAQGKTRPTNVVDVEITAHIILVYLVVQLQKELLYYKDLIQKKLHVVPVDISDKNLGNKKY